MQSLPRQLRIRDPDSLCHGREGGRQEMTNVEWMSREIEG